MKIMEIPVLSLAYKVSNSTKHHTKPPTPIFYPEIILADKNGSSESRSYDLEEWEKNKKRIMKYYLFDESKSQSASFQDDLYVKWLEKNVLEKIVAAPFS